MAIYSSILAGRIPWTEEPGGLESMGSQRVGHDRATNTVTVTHYPVSPVAIVSTCSCAFSQSELVECILVVQWSTFYHLRSRAVVRKWTVGGESDEVNNVTKTGDKFFCLE